MLVLSRRAEQQIVFPNLGVRVRILQVRGRIVKVGIEAPPEIQILREEMKPYLTEDSSSLLAEKKFPLVENSAPTKKSRDATSSSMSGRVDDDQAEHQRRNDLNVLQLRLDLLQDRIDSGEVVDAQSLIDALAERPKRNFVRSNASAAPDKLMRPIRLLIVEDSDNERGLMTHVLASRGYVVHVARDGAEALAQLQQWGVLPDVILMDMHMPLYDGLEALHRIREDDRFRDLRVYAVTGSVRVEEDEPIGHGWDRWFSKPVAVSQLIQSIEEDVRHHESLAKPSPVSGEYACPKV